jgi:PAS domain S-box-containing protein
MLKQSAVDDRDLDDPPMELAALREEIQQLRQQLSEAEGTLDAIRNGQVDAVVVDRGGRAQVYALAAADRFYFQLAQEAGNIGSWDLNVVTGEVFWSDGIYRLLGYEPRSVSSTAEAFMQAVHPDDLDRAVQVFRQATSQVGDFYNEFRILRRDGAVRWLASRGTSIADGRGLIHRVVGINIDITDRKNTEEALRQSEARFRQLANTLPQMVWTTRADGTADYFNERWYEFTGSPRDLIGDASFLPYMHPDDHEPMLAAWYTAVRKGKPYEVEYRLRHGATGAWRWFLARGLPLRNSAGEVESWFGTSTDIHEIKEARDLLQEADRRKDEFLAMLGHELRNPLSAVANGLHLLTVDGIDDAGRNWAIELMQRQVKSLTHMVDDLLDVSRITRGKIQLKLEPLSIADLLRRAAEAVKPMVQSAGHTLSVSLPTEAVWISGDATRMEQVVTNLLTNSCKYTRPGGQIWLSAQRQGESVRIAVRDTGIGIGPDILPKIFELFVQADRALDRSEGGLGIGLTVVKRLVEMHNGHITADSAGEGQGSEFCVMLPLIAPPNRVRESQPTSMPASSDKQVLVVDDNVDAALTLKMLLRTQGYTITLAHDGAQAIEMAKEVNPAIVLLDIGLPGMDGYAVARRLRAEPQFVNAVLIAISGYGQEEDRQRSREAGFDHHLVKPVDFAALRTLLTS